MLVAVEGVCLADGRLTDGSLARLGRERPNNPQGCNGRGGDHGHHPYHDRRAITSRAGTAAKLVWGAIRAKKPGSGFLGSSGVIKSTSDVRREARLRGECCLELPIWRLIIAAVISGFKWD